MSPVSRSARLRPSLLSAAVAVLAVLAGPIAAQDVSPLAPPPENAPAAPSGPLPSPEADPEPDLAEPPIEAEDLDTVEINESQPPEPNAQGTRDPMANPGNDEEDTLYGLLSAVRRAPPGLDGVPTPRPNALASEPAKEMEPQQPEDLYLFPDGYVE
ncbi:hypothetical protein ACFQXB_10930 [Plastorhodobacter daqingensis]|uniref:Uncharacterized protein n=1 Tax=Plastorhodobacter daqingensis TaxID=1387281 RepID=A0ABW2UJ23_9RHOB